MNTDTFYIEKWQIDLLHNSIQQGDIVHELEPKAMEVLVYLAKRAGKTIDKHEIQKAVWPDEEVTGAALSRIIGHLRRCFDDNTKPPGYIMTIRKTGYRLVAKVTPKNFFSQHSEELTFAGIGAGKLYSLVAVLIISLLLLYQYWSPTVKEAQVIESQYITTARGSEFSPALSPDGTMVAYKKKKIGSKKVSYQFLNSLVIKHIKSNKITLLTDQNGVSFHPAWSPDNHYVAYTHEAELSDEKVSYEVYIVNVKTKDIERVAKLSSHAHGMTWSPDGRYLVFPENSIDNKVPALTQLNISTKQKRFLIGPDSSNGYYTHPNYSPDGKNIAVVRTEYEYGSFDSIELIDTETLSRKVVFDQQQRISSIAWKNNNTLFIVLGGVASGQLLEFSLVDGEYKKIPIGHNYIEYISYSWEAQRLIFEEPKTAYNIFYTRYADDDYKVLGFRTLTNSNRQDLEGVESPDGNTLALISSRSGALEVWLKDNAVEQTQKLTDIKANNIKGLDWSPDSDKLAFVATINNETALYWVEVNSKQLHKFSRGESNYSLIGWDKQSESLLFASDTVGRWQLWRYYPNNKAEELVSDIPVIDGRLSPDREALYIVKDKTPGIWQSQTDDFAAVLVPGTESMVTTGSSWTVAENGIYFLKQIDAGKNNKLYFQRFGEDLPIFISEIMRIHVNRIYWSKNRLFYSAHDIRDSDVVMIENLK